MKVIKLIVEDNNQIEQILLWHTNNIYKVIEI